MLRPTIVIFALYIMLIILFPDVMQDSRENRFLIFACITLVVGARAMEEMK